MKRLFRRTPSWKLRIPSSFTRRVTYYDSQSGLHVTYSDHPSLHLVPPTPDATVDTDALGAYLGRGFYFSSLMWPTKPDPHTLASCLEARHPDRGAMDQFVTMDTHTPADVQALVQGSPNQLAVALSLQCTASRGEWDAVVALAKSAKGQGAGKVRVTLRGALEVDPDELQLAACLLADVGVELIVLEDDTFNADDDNVTDAIEALVYCDVAGVPMKHRIGLCLPENTKTLDLLALAAGMGVKHFDSCLRGKRAPTPDRILMALNEAAIEHNQHINPINHQ